MDSLYAVVPDMLAKGPDPRSAVVLLWTLIAITLAFLLWPGGRGRRLARQIFAVAVLGFREGVRLKVLWTVFALALVPCALSYYSDADGTHVGRASLILTYGLTTGEVLGAGLIVLLSALSVAREIESRIMHTFGTKPVPRWAILAGKALGFWVIDLLFLVGVTVMTGLLVRAVPARAETREGNPLVRSGTWEDLRRNVLTTRQFQLSDEDTDPTIPTYKMTRPGKKSEWFFTLDPALDRKDPLAIRFHLSSSRTFSPDIERVGLTVACENAATPLYTRTGTVPQDRPFDLFINLPDGPLPERVVVTLAASDQTRLPPSVVGTVRLGVTADGFTRNLVKAFLIMALQGWILALITTGWSGILSFPMTVALGAILVLGGEMSRHAIELMQSSAQRAAVMGLAPSGDTGMQRLVTNQLRTILGLLPDFRAAGSPVDFVEGIVLSGWAFAHAVLMVGLVRGVGWALPGIVFFQRREVGR